MIVEKGFRDLKRFSFHFVSYTQIVDNDRMIDELWTHVCIWMEDKIEISVKYPYSRSENQIVSAESRIYTRENMTLNLGCVTLVI